MSGFETVQLSMEAYQISIKSGCGGNRRRSTKHLELERGDAPDLLIVDKNEERRTRGLHPVKAVEIILDLVSTCLRVRRGKAQQKHPPEASGRTSVPTTHRHWRPGCKHLARARADELDASLHACPACAVAL